MKQHLTKDGPKPCTASVRDCPVGGPEVHYENFERAQEAFEQSMASEYGEINTLKKSVRTDSNNASRMVNVSAATVRFNDIATKESSKAQAATQEAVRIYEETVKAIPSQDLNNPETLLALSKFRDDYVTKTYEKSGIRDSINETFKNNGVNLEVGYIKHNFKRDITSRDLKITDPKILNGDSSEKKIAREYLIQDFKNNGGYSDNRVVSPDSKWALGVTKGFFKNSFYVTKNNFISESERESYRFNNFDDAYAALSGKDEDMASGKRIKESDPFAFL